MRASEVLLKVTPGAFEGMHAARRGAVLRAVDALAAGGRLTLMDLARAAPDAAYVWAPLKAFDRLLSNRHLWAERGAVYAGLNAAWAQQRRPVVLVDWTDMKADRSIHLLRCARAAGSRALPVLDRVFSNRQQQTPAAHAQVLAELRGCFAPEVAPILVGDAGFGITWVRQAHAVGFSVIVRLRGVTQVAAAGSDTFIPLAALHAGAGVHAEDLGPYQITLRHGYPLRLIRVRLSDRQRRKLTAWGTPAQRNACAKANAEPWLLAVSPALDDLSAEEIVRIYAMRMQIEESFRDLKNERFGHALCHSQTRTADRLLMLILIDTLLTYAAFWLGLLAKRDRQDLVLMPHRQASRRSRPFLSLLRIGRELLRRRTRWRPIWPCCLTDLRRQHERMYAADG